MRRLILLLLMLTGCAAENNRVADRIIGVNKEIQKHTYERLQTGRDNNDKWSERLAILGVIIAGLSFRKRHVTIPLQAVKRILPLTPKAVMG